VDFGRGRMVPKHILKKNSHNLSCTLFITKNLEKFGLFDKPFVRVTYGKLTFGIALDPMRKA